jgi:TRAP-type C4-dicarboxylate transport system permease small subunit
MRKTNVIRLVTLIVSIGSPFILTQTALAATGDISSVESFIRSIIQVIAGLAGLVATGFFVVGGFSYITSSGNPEHLDKAKRTLLFSSVGLAIVIAAFVLSNIVTTLATNAFGK